MLIITGSIMKIIILAMIVSALLVAPLSVSSDYMAMATNSVSQGINQEQLSDQLAQCISGQDTSLSCNNLNIQDQSNTGNNVAGQQDEDSDSGDNSAEQGISQSQTSNQGSLCVSGGDTSASCNNFNSQTQANYGNNVIGQTR